nr:phospholipid carrier-dependent glycosyltransferase [Sanguibacter antarcticus]
MSATNATPTDVTADSGDSDDPPVVSTHERLLGALFTPRALALGSTSRDRFWSWAGPGLVALLAAILRLVNLGFPSTLVFDETYYVKGAYSLLTLGYEADWPEGSDFAFENGDQSGHLTAGDYVVHPPVGKWMIALGMRLAGPENAWGWRLASAVVGIVAVFLLARTARRIFGSTAIGVIVGGLFAIDGAAIVHARTGLLDSFVMFWVLVAFACIVADRSWARRRLAERAAAAIDSGAGLGRYGPTVGWRWWRLAAAVALGLACGTKWSGLYFVAVFGIMSVSWDAAARRAVGVRSWLVGTLLKDLVPAVTLVIPTTVLTYLASWSSWFAHSASYDRTWWTLNRGSYPSWMPDVLTGWGEALRSLWAYHESMWRFHTGLVKSHTYESNPWGWLLQLRPTSFYWEKSALGENGCTASECARAVTSIGNPLIWWVATVALVFAVWALLRYRDWRAAAVLSGILAGWVPWLFVAERTIFTFYSIAFAPWMYLAIGYLVVTGWERLGDAPRSRRLGLWATGALLAVFVGVSAFFYPVWTGIQVPYEFWQAHMWLGSWV